MTPQNHSGGERLKERMRKDGIEKFVTTGKIEGKRDRGRQRKKYLDSLCHLQGGNYRSIDVIHATEDRGKWRSIIADAVNLQGTSELSMGRLSVPKPNPTHQLPKPTQPPKNFRLLTQPNPVFFSRYGSQNSTQTQPNP